MKFLIAEDSITATKVVTKMLNQLGYFDILEAKDGFEALSKLEGIDILITDWKMPKMDGITLVRKIRELSEYNNIKIIMLTTETAKNEVIEASKAGINQYIMKPFTLNDLKDRINLLTDKQS